MNDDSEALLTSSLERFQEVTVDGVKVVVSVMDAFLLGEGSTFGGNHEADEIFLFAESVVLKGRLACKSAVISVNSLAGKGQISTSGAVGESVMTQNLDKNKPGKPGGDGTAAGALSLYLENALGDAPYATLAAAGGKGGDGEVGVSAPGGEGGNGGDGGKATLFAGTRSAGYLVALRGVLGQKTLAAKKQAVKRLLDEMQAAVGTTSKWQKTLDTLKNAQAAATDAAFEGLIRQAGEYLGALQDNDIRKALAAIDVAGGAYGAYGPGDPSGNGGKSGSKGSRKVISFGTAEDIAVGDLPASILVHPSQCARLLEVIRLRYLTLDPVQHPQGVRDLAAVLVRLEARTRPFAALKEGSELAGHYAKYERKAGAVDSVAQLRGINQQCTVLLAQLRGGQDSFGYDAHWSPLASFDFYKKLLGDMIDNFSAIEQDYLKYFADLKQNKASMEAVRTARGKYASAASEAEEELKLIGEALSETARLISHYAITLPPLKSDLEEKIRKFQSDIENHFSFDFKQLISALSTVAFAPQSKFMIATQFGGLLYQADSSITQDTGVPVDKSYLVDQIKAVGSSVHDLIEGFKSLDNGMLQPDDPGAAKLLAVESTFRQEFDKLKSEFGVDLKEVEDAFSAYIEQILARNQQILLYNAHVLLAARDHRTIQDARNHIAALNDKALDEMRPDLPDLVSFVSRLYYASRDQIMRALSLTTHAYRMWALSDRDLIAEAYGGRTMATIDHGVLASAANTVLDAYGSAVESFGTQAQRFPAKPEQEGLVVKASQAQIDVFRTGNVLMVKLQAVAPATDMATSPFAGKANVRASKVRAWIKGAATTNEHKRLNVQITQSGTEQIVNPHGDVFDFTHARITKTFSYDLGDRTVFQEADFESESDSPHKSYATVGPFTTWQIEVRPEDNSSLDLSGVTEVSLEFHGTSYAFTV
ncbi:hypothetical protein ACFVHI_00485 [Kitasatospora sp. NPDC127121]|uniref:hypothetical protein n=1 Tax=Kitasatospora sp. NPDC127121 TaxID=3345371 RepID=UPI003641B225